MLRRDRSVACRLSPLRVSKGSAGKLSYRASVEKSFFSRNVVDFAPSGSVELYSSQRTINRGAVLVERKTPSEESGHRLPFPRKRSRELSASCFPKLLCFRSDLGRGQRLPSR